MPNFPTTDPALTTSLADGVDDVLATHINDPDAEINAMGAAVRRTAAIASIANTETLAGSKTLTNNDIFLQYLDPGGAGRNVYLPAASTDNYAFFIVNTADAAETLTVLTSSSDSVDTVAQNEAKIFVSNGTTWRSHSGGGGGTTTTDPGFVRVLKTMPTSSDAATIDFRAGGSTPGEQVMVYDFDAASIEYMDFLCRLEEYGGNGLTFTIAWSATSATSGNVVWQLAIRAFPAAGGEDVDVSHTYDYNSVTAAAPSTSGDVAYSTITFTAGADMDSWANAELAILRLRRNASSSDDTMTGDAELWWISGRETT